MIQDLADGVSNHSKRDHEDAHKPGCMSPNCQAVTGTDCLRYYLTYIDMDMDKVAEICNTGALTIQFGIFMLKGHMWLGKPLCPVALSVCALGVSVHSWCA